MDKEMLSSSDHNSNIYSLNYELKICESVIMISNAT